MLLNREQQVALLNQRPVGKVDLVQITFHPRDQRHRIHRYRVAGKVEVIRYVLCNRSRDRTVGGVMAGPVFFPHAEIAIAAAINKAQFRNRHVRKLFNELVTGFSPFGRPDQGALVLG